MHCKQSSGLRGAIWLRNPGGGATRSLSVGCIRTMWPSQASWIESATMATWTLPQAARTSSGSLLTLTISHGLRYSTGASVATVMPR